MCCCYYMVKGFWCCETVVGRILRGHSLRRGSREYLKQSGEWVPEARLAGTFIGFRVCRLSLPCKGVFSQRELSEEEQGWRESPGGEAEVGGWSLWRMVRIQSSACLMEQQTWDNPPQSHLFVAFCLWESGTILAKDTGMVIVSNKLGKHRWTSMLIGTVD